MPGDLNTSFLFVPDGDPEPTEWMAQHPGWVRFPGTMLRGRGARRTLPPIPAAALAATAAAASPGFLEGAVGRNLAVAGVDDILAAAAGPLMALGILLRPTRTASRNMDELPPELRPKVLRNSSAGFVPPPSVPAPPGLVPPAGVDTIPGEGGFTPTPPTPPPPGFTPTPPQSNVLPGRPAEEQGATILDRDRNEGLEGGARTSSKHARNAARAADPAVTQTLRNDEWRAHHLINLAAIRDFRDLIHEAVKAGWRTDDIGNVAAAPATREAQRKLKQAGIDRPLHDNGHKEWNEMILRKLSEIQNKLKRSGLTKGTTAYTKRAKEELELLQDEVRQEMLGRHRLTQNDRTGGQTNAG